MCPVTFLYFLLVLTSLSNQARISAAEYNAGLDVFTNDERDFEDEYQLPLDKTCSKILVNFLKGMNGLNKEYLFQVPQTVRFNRKESGDDMNDIHSIVTKRGLSTFAKSNPTMYFKYKPEDSKFFKSFVRGKFGASGYSFGRPRPLRWG